MKAKIIKFDRQKANFDDGFRLFQRFSDTGKPTASSTNFAEYQQFEKFTPKTTLKN